MAAQRTKADEAYQRIKESLHTGIFAPGEVLTEAKIVKTLRLPRGSVRESLLRLEGEGLVRTRGAYRGKTVEFLEDQNQQDLIYHYELREAIQGLAARLAAMGMNGWQIERLRALGQRVEEVTAISDRDARIEASLAFNDYLVANCGNPLFARIWDQYHLQPVVSRSPALEAKVNANMPPDDEPPASILDIVEAIADRKPDLAERMMRSRIRRITEALRVTTWTKTE